MVRAPPIFELNSPRLHSTLGERYNQGGEHDWDFSRTRLFYIYALV